MRLENRLNENERKTLNIIVIFKEEENKCNKT